MSRDELSRFIPHHGDMRLLDFVERWDESGIVCLAGSHRLAKNPLRSGNRLNAISGLEYAAQAMAVHVGLVGHEGQPRSRLGYLGGVRDLRLGAEHLDDYAEDLRIQATRLFSNETGFLYSFVVLAGAEELLSGRASIFLKFGNAGI